MCLIKKLMNYRFTRFFYAYANFEIDWRGGVMKVFVEKIKTAINKINASKTPKQPELTYEMFKGQFIPQYNEWKQQTINNIIENGISSQIQGETKTNTTPQAPQALPPPPPPEAQAQALPAPPQQTNCPGSRCVTMGGRRKRRKTKKKKKKRKTRKRKKRKNKKTRRKKR